MILYSYYTFPIANILFETEPKAQGTLNEVQVQVPLAADAGLCR
jgi:hypothetical protein